MPAFLPYGTASGEHRAGLAMQAGAVAGRIYGDAEQQICALTARLAGRVLRGGLQPRGAQHQLGVLGAAILARAAEQLGRELALAGRQVVASAAPDVTASPGADGSDRGDGASAADEVTRALDRPAGWGSLRDRVGAAGATALRTAAAALAVAVTARLAPQGGTRAAQQAAEALATAKALDSLPDRLAAYTDTAGRTWGLGAYVSAAVTAAASMFHIVRQMISLRVAGAGLVIVEPGGGCVKCAPWAGKILSLTGDIPPGTRVAGTMADALAAGVGHPHCRHSFNPVAA